MVCRVLPVVARAAAIAEPAALGEAVGDAGLATPLVCSAIQDDLHTAIVLELAAQRGEQVRPRPGHHEQEAGALGKVVGVRCVARGHESARLAPERATVNRALAGRGAVHGRTVGASIFVPPARHIRKSSRSTSSGAPYS